MYCAEDTIALQLPAEGLSPVDGELFIKNQFSHVFFAGVDEAGRGPLAGPVVAASVWLADPSDIPGLNDSKKLSEKKRLQLEPLVKAKALRWAVGSASPAEIDQVNILNATFLAMRRCLAAMSADLVRDMERFPGEADACGGTASEEQLRGQWFVLVDGDKRVRGLKDCVQHPLIEGDGRIACIGAASILAKCERDRRMIAMAETYPGYGFEKHKGYPCKSHLDAIKELGFCPEHRRSFRPKALSQLDLGL